MALEEFDFLSRNGRDRIQAWIYTPVVPPRGIVQLIHGLGEHSRRYFRLITQLLDQGFVVAADDHAGHGKTAMVSGIWADTGPEGAEAVVADEQTLREKVTARFPELPYFVFGHSWGSIIARMLTVREPKGISGLLLCGIAAQVRSMDTLDLEAVQAAIGDTDGSRPAEEFLPALFEGFVSRYEDVEGPTDWVALDRDVVRDHKVDPLNRFGEPLSLRFLHDFVALYRESNESQTLARIPTDLPVLILAGDQDPVTNYGEGAYRVANVLAEAGNRRVRTCVYSGFRHEVHNEPPIREDVTDEILTFLDANLS
ncbi:alpha/beta hydrolase [Nesterenkonia sp. MY13]|uniref:Alpha/beta hydrolase n=1 Tax=Nesterenkonia sedimenti TaxID=1463632 RepID=A0A7X8TKQ7_9MICC|nr:alpha/beta hydrolase [Nesterenkonia sedimenti]NLS10473.1 alpha/beta hydrolase [Nesterenkonia sedimenti]